MKIQFVLILIILFFSSEKIICQTSKEILSDRDSLSNLYNVEVIKSDIKLFCTTGSYYAKYFNKINDNLKFVIKYDCHDKLTHSNHSCNAFTPGAITEYIYNSDSEIEKIITYDQDLKTIAINGSKSRIKTFNEEEEILTSIIEGKETYIIVKTILVNLKPFKTFVIDQDGNILYYSNQKPRKKTKRKYK